MLKKATIIIGTEQIKAEHFQKATNLKAVIKFGVGTDNIDKDAAEKHGVKVLNLPGVNSDAVAYFRGSGHEKDLQGPDFRDAGIMCIMYRYGSNTRNSRIYLWISASYGRY